MQPSHRQLRTDLFTRCAKLKSERSVSVALIRHALLRSHALAIAHSTGFPVPSLGCRSPPQVSICALTPAILGIWCCSLTRCTSCTAKRSLREGHAILHRMSVFSRGACLSPNIQQRLIQWAREQYCTKAMHKDTNNSEREFRDRSCGVFMKFAL